MDLVCPSCGEAWDVYHMRHDVWREWDLNTLQQTELKENGSLGTATGAIPREAERHGWVFGAESLLSFVRCPSCPPAPVDDLSATALKIAIFANAAGDEDAATAELVAAGLATP